MTTKTAPVAKLPRMTSAALRVLAQAVSDELNREDMEDRITLIPGGNKHKAAGALAKRGLGEIVLKNPSLKPEPVTPGSVGAVLPDFRFYTFVPNAAGLAWAAENQAALDEATDILNQRGASVHF